MQISKENLPKLRLSCSLTRSQATNAFSSRHKVQSSYENILEISDTASTPNRIRSKDQLAIIDESLDSKEISLRNIINKDNISEFSLYQEHLEVIATLIKKSNPRLGFSISRGITGCFKAFSSLQLFKMSEKTTPLIPHIEKKPSRDSICQTEEFSKFEMSQMIKNEDIELLKSISFKLSEINFRKVTVKLRDLDKSLRRISTDLPELSQIPELGNFDAHDTIAKIENHVKSIQQEVTSELMKRKIACLPMNVSTQTEIKLIDPHKYLALENLLCKKEEEIFEWKKKYEILNMDKVRLSDRLDEVQLYFDEAQKHLLKLREKAARSEYAEKNSKAKYESVSNEIQKKKDTIEEVKGKAEEYARKYGKQRIREKELVRMWKNTVVENRVMEHKLKEIEEAFRSQTGKVFKYSYFDIEKIASGVVIPDLNKEDISDSEFELMKQEDLKTVKKIDKIKESFFRPENQIRSIENSGEPNTRSTRNMKKRDTNSFIDKNNKAGTSGPIPRNSAAQSKKNISEQEESPEAFFTRTGQHKITGHSNEDRQANIGNLSQDSIRSKRLSFISKFSHPTDSEDSDLSNNKSSSPSRRHKEGLSTISSSPIKRHRVQQDVLEDDSDNSEYSRETPNFSPNKKYTNPKGYLSKFVPENSDSQQFSSDEQESPDYSTQHTSRPSKLSKRTLININTSHNETFNKEFSQDQVSPQKKTNKSHSNDFKYANSDLTTTYSNNSFSNKGSQVFEDTRTEAERINELIVKLQQKCLDLQQGSQAGNLIVEDPEEYARNTYSLFNMNDILHKKILTDFPDVNTIPKKYQIEIFKLMAEHEKSRCSGKCKHLTRVQLLKYRVKGVPYPIRKMTVELKRK